MLSIPLGPKVITLSGFHHTKPGGLDSRDRMRVNRDYSTVKISFWKLSRISQLSRLALSMGVSTVETDRDQDFSICRDQLLKLVEIILAVETRLFFFSVEIFKIGTF